MLGDGGVPLSRKRLPKCAGAHLRSVPADLSCSVIVLRCTDSAGSGGVRNSQVQPKSEIPSSCQGLSPPMTELGERRPGGRAEAWLQAQLRKRTGSVVH